jgi:NAD(P)-dependent dehydrogenase (short-subunit alcohol dehydrogenase family)
MKRFAERVAVVTGGASGIGRAMAERFAREGMKIVLADIEQAPLDQAEREMRENGANVIGVRTDVTEEAQVKSLAARAVQGFGAVHLVCNNAGVGSSFGPTWEQSAADWKWVLDVNLWGVIHGVRTFAPILLAQQDEGHIVNTASVAGLSAAPFMGPYNASKFAVVGLTESLYYELKVIQAQVSTSVPLPGLGKDSHRRFRAEPPRRH